MKKGFTLAEGVTHAALQHDQGKNAFTLAEVLVTLGIIGIVAAMTMPALIANHQKKATAVKLARFYTIMSQAVLRWQSDDGIIPDDFSFEETSGTYIEKWYRDTIGKYIQTVSLKSTNSIFSAAFNDGSGFDAYISGQILHIFYCTEYKYCRQTREGNFDGRTGFLFGIYKGKFITSNPENQTQTREKLLDLCKYGNSDNAEVSSKGRRHACTRLIQIDGWEIKKDYPWGQTMLEK